MLRHAYLIMAHQYTFVLERLVQLLDDNNNDIFIHMDKKATKIEKKKLKEIQNLAQCSKVYVFSRYKVYWGTNSIINAQMYLLRNAVKGEYSYYHFLSGSDLPIKSKSAIQRFFAENDGKEFIHFGTEQYQHDIVERYNVYHFFTRQLGRKRDKKFWVSAETYSLAIQRRLRIDRTRRLNFDYYGGSNWCSITNGFARHMVDCYPRYKKFFRFSQISDEAVIQTIVMDSPFKENLYVDGFTNDYNACVRYIDWERGTPYVFHREDFEDLMISKYMFARKFDENTDRVIVEMIYQTLKEKI